MRNVFYAILITTFALGIYSCGRLHAEENESGEVFEFREIYLPEYTEKVNSDLHLDYLDKSWGIWGHNLNKVLPEDPSSQVFAKKGSAVIDEQFCFSNDKLFDYIAEFIDNNYIFTDSVRFAILPNDNDIVCLCADCVRLGNSEGDASPAVFHLINRLAKKYPEHKFFTSHYSTTRQLPAEKMPKNTGVLISTMEYPLSAAATPKENEFMELIGKWKEKTDRIYVWDYVQNFDDYFTPFPVFAIMQRRLQKFRDAGVNGVFLNGSGPDFSTFGRLKKAVLARLLENPDRDWQTILRECAVELYPSAGNDIADFMIAQEKMVTGNGKKLPLYEGISTAISTYLPEQNFVEFYNKLVHHKREATGQEKEDLELLTDAMAYTMLELKRINNDVENTEKLKERLGRLPAKGIESYNEGCWMISQYLDDYNFMERNLRESGERNRLKGTKLVARTPLDEDYTDISILTDGLLGIPSNYHNGNLISSADPALIIAIPSTGGATTLRVWMVHNPAFRIGLPEDVSVTVGGVKRPPKVPEKPQGSTGHSFLDFDISGGGEVLLTLRKSPDVKTMAVDEIEAF